MFFSFLSILLFLGISFGETNYGDLDTTEENTVFVSKFLVYPNSKMMFIEDEDDVKYEKLTFLYGDIEKEMNSQKDRESPLFVYVSKIPPELSCDKLMVFFKEGSFALSGEVKNKLENFGRCLSFTGKKNIVIRSFADDFVNDKDNMELAKKRFGQVKKYLFKSFGLKGIKITGDSKVVNGKSYVEVLVE